MKANAHEDDTQLICPAVILSNWSQRYWGCFWLEEIDHSCIKSHMYFYGSLFLLRKQNTAL